MDIKKYMYVVGMSYMGNLNSFVPEVICGTYWEAKKWIKEKINGYQHSGIGMYTVREIPYVN
jgi:hypothetical protein